MTNYHTHTYRCDHATGDIPDYVEEARAAGLTELGFSDHVPQPDGRWAYGRMDLGELPGYIAAVRTARAGEAGRAKGLSIRLGLECEWAPDLAAYYRDELLGRYGIEYLVAGIHVYCLDGRYGDSFAISKPKALAAYARQVEGAVASGLFAYLAHPDVFCNGYLPWDADAEACARDIIEACAAAQLPMEINGNGMRKPLVRAPEGRRWAYPHRSFWELAADYPVQAILGSDAHEPENVAGGLAEGQALAAELGIPVLAGLGLLVG